jgi:uncharacterized membrane protein HdeD (DUF308 family)
VAASSLGGAVIQALAKTWWLLALCGILEAIYSVINVFMQRPDGSLTVRTFVLRGTVVHLGMLALAAGVSAAAAGIWSSRMGKAWLLVLNGLALTVLGLIFMFWRGRLAFRTIALLIVVMAVSIGIFELTTARTLRHPVPDKWFLSLTGIGSVSFALVFLALGFRWINLPRPEALNLWMGSFFSFSAICMLGLALRLGSLQGFAPKSFDASAPV